MTITTAQTGRIDAKSKPAGLVRYRWAVASRALAAIGGGYALSAAVASALSLVLPLLGMPRADAVVAGTLLGFVLHAVAAMWAFGCATAWRAWIGIAGPAALASAIVWWFPKGH
ncbi:hypothetical protein [Ottowia thiooxydans]|uniref:hypothetical protein n=1 Tax=Ottowia thiooxydans TaxID=219182 RepID=UPI000405B6F7|nr:hypothetical protein [Ottowia thiooxydans]